MPRHHPGTFVANNNLEPASIPRALTTHLLSINHEQLLDVTRPRFLEHAACGTLSKSVIAQWLANYGPYLNSYISLIGNTLDRIGGQSNPIERDAPEFTLASRTSAMLQSSLANAKREAEFIVEVADIYDLDISTAASGLQIACEGLHRYQSLFAAVSAHPPSDTAPWLEGLVLVWATEKMHYEAWSWAHRQFSSPREPSLDEDSGAMRREFFPNWSNKHFMHFVEQLERTLNEGVSHATALNDTSWTEVKSRADAVWKAALNAEATLWPQVPGLPECQFKESNDSLSRSTLSRMNEQMFSAVALGAAR